MEVSQPEALSKDTIESQLSSLGDDELKLMGQRVAKSIESAEEMLEELNNEQQSLREENAQLNDTISLMMKEMQKLNIGGENCVTPQLDENPLNMVGRWWEKLKPRDTGVVVDEHIGEIKKPGAVPEGGYQTATPQQVGKEVAQKAWGALGPLWKKAGDAINDAKGEITKQMSEHSERQRQNQEQQQSSKASRPKRSHKERQGRGEHAAPPAPAESSPSQASSSASAPAPAPAPDADASASAAAPSAAPSANAAVESSSSAPSAAVDTTAPAGERSEGAEDQISSTILIEAQIKLDDGTTQTLQLRAADRCKEVSKRFIAEHSLKGVFQEPLTAWLKQVEADAEKFPVEIEADLMEIRKEHSKK